MTWLTIVQAIAALYLVCGALAIDASANLGSRVLFKVIPMLLGLPMALGVFAQLRGWPL